MYSSFFQFLKHNKRHIRASASVSPANFSDFICFSPQWEPSLALLLSRTDGHFAAHQRVNMRQPVVHPSHRLGRPCDRKMRPARSALPSTSLLIDAPAKMNVLQMAPSSSAAANHQCVSLPIHGLKGGGVSNHYRSKKTILASRRLVEWSISARIDTTYSLRARMRPTLKAVGEYSSPYPIFGFSTLTNRSFPIRRCTMVQSRDMYFHRPTLPLFFQRVTAT